jgi:YrbI family 3-deoxy-D-manno-octulosonate 8-phosphate phosphatase
VDDKLPALERWLAERGADLEHTVYVGNDINDIACLRAAGFSVAVADADPRAKDAADWVCSKPGGYGAVRELCELLLKRRTEDPARDGRDG